MTMIFDKVAMLTRFGNNQSFAQEFFNKFIDSLTAYEIVLQETQDHKILSSKMHELKGCAAYCSAIKLYDLITEFEYILKNNPTHNTVLKAKLSQVLLAIQELKNYHVDWT